MARRWPSPARPRPPGRRRASPSMTFSSRARSSRRPKDPSRRPGGERGDGEGARRKRDVTQANERGRRKVRTGVVVSDAMDKTVLVKIDRQIRHPLYQKTVRRSSRLAAHDEANEAHVGDTVRVVETRPLSKTKRWRVVEIVERAK